MGRIIPTVEKSLSKHKRKLDVQTDEPTSYYLNCPNPDRKGKPIFFGAVQLRKSYVSFHLMPVFMYPDLLDGISPELKKRMQGKSCFNFKKIDDVLFKELDTLTKNALQRFKSEGHL